jgi:hypothetical protein
LEAGLAASDLYFNIEKVGNASSASIPLAIHDAVRDGIITEPVRIFTPGFGAGAVAGYAVMRIDPAVVAIIDQPPAWLAAPTGVTAAAVQPSSQDVTLAFG